MELKRGTSLWQVTQKYHIGYSTARRFKERFEKYGMDGLQYREGVYHPQAIKLSALEDFEKNGLTLEEICSKYDIHRTTFKHWQVLYEAYKKGDKFALNGNGAIHKGEVYSSLLQPQPSAINTRQEMPESKERTERRKALSNLNRKELQELLLDREAELDILKKLEALDQEREMRRHAIWHKSSQD